MENIPVWLRESVHDCRPSHHLSTITFNPQADPHTFPVVVVAESEGVGGLCRGVGGGGGGEAGGGGKTHGGGGGSLP